MTHESGPVFTCGPSRSGTAMLRSILNRHPRVFLAGETHYFDDLRARLGDRAVSGVTAEEARACEDYFLAISHRPYGHMGDPEQSRHSRADLRRKAEEIGGSSPGGDAYFEAYCRLEASSEGAVVWGEKTPRHVFRIAEILEAFPRAKVVCMVRDARAVVASYRDWKNQGGFDFEKDPGHADALARDHERARKSYHPIILSMLWRGAIGASYAALDRFGPERVRVQRYEDLVVNPEETIRDLATWVGVDYDAAMLQVPMHNSSYSRYTEQNGVSTAPKDRWRQTLSAHEIGVVDQICGPLLRRAGYDVIGSGGVKARAREMWWWVTLPLAVLRAAAVNRGRIANLPAYVLRRLFPSSSVGTRRARPARG